MGITTDLASSLVRHLNLLELNGLRIVAQNVDKVIYKDFLEMFKRILVKEENNDNSQYKPDAESNLAPAIMESKPKKGSPIEKKTEITVEDERNKFTRFRRKVPSTAL